MSVARCSSPVNLVARVRGYQKDWATQVTDADLANLDFSWMRELRAYDHWSLWADGPMPKAPPTDLRDEQLPDVVVLQEWGKLRYAAALRNGDFDAAAQDVRHLAALLTTQDTLIAYMVGTSLARQEQRAHAAALQKGQDVARWTPHVVNEEALDQYKRVARASLGFLMPGVPAEVMQKAVACMPQPCMPLFECLRGQCVLATFWPDSNRAQVEAMAVAAGCDGAMLESTRRCRPASPEEAFQWSGSP